MAFAQSPSNSDIYSQAKEVKQYEAFVISILLFGIMLFAFLYLFLKKQASTFSHAPPLPPTLAQTPSFSFVISVSDVGLKEDLIDKLPTIVFDEELKARETLCSVCLGEFEMKEELIQVPCKHFFHRDCIRNWLGSKTTCPLCRCSVVIVVDNTKLVGPPPQTSPALLLLPAATSVQLAATSYSRR